MLPLMRTSEPARTLSTPHFRRRSGPLLLVIAAVILLTALGAGGTQAETPARYSSSGLITGITDALPEMFSDPHWQRLHTKTSRYIAPFDAAVHPDDLARARAWIGAAEGQHQQILLTFYHSQHSPTRLPSVAVYRRDVQKFLRLFPQLKLYIAWGESNRGNVPGGFSSPSAYLTAEYYKALSGMCSHCTVLGLALLDGQNINPSINYIHEFKRAIVRLHAVMPTVWGLHNYSDVNRFGGWRTRELVRALGGQVWVAETGGVVRFGKSFPNHGGSGAKRAARALERMFSIARANPRIKRLYIYNWTGATARSEWDSGLTDAHFRPRRGYVVVCKELHDTHCNVAISHH